MDKETLSNYGWIVICVLVLSVMIALATPFGTYISDGVKATTAGLFETSKNALDTGLEEAGITIEDQEFEGVNTIGGNTGSAPTVDPTLNHRDIIPKGATYTLANGTVLGAGENFPATPQYLDAYRYGDYTYVYSAGYIAEPYTAPFNEQFQNGNYEGWLVTVRQETPDGADFFPYQLKKSDYGTVLEYITGKPVTSMEYTFWRRWGMNSIENIPNTIINMNSTFYDANLRVAPIVPESVLDLTSTFCSSQFVNELVINANPTVYDSCLDFILQDTVITGTSKMLQELAATNSFGYVTIK